MKDVNDYEMILDIQKAFNAYRDNLEGIKKVSKASFLRLIGMSAQTAHNYQKGLSSHRVLQLTEKIQETTGLSKDEIIIRINN